MSGKTSGFITKYIAGVIRKEHNAEILEDTGHDVGVIDGQVYGTAPGDLLMVRNAFAKNEDGEYISLYVHVDDVLEKSDDPIEIKVGL